MFDKVLVTTDGSKLAETAVPTAIGLAKDCEAELRCMTVAELLPYYGMAEAAALYDTEYYRSLSKEVDKLAQQSVDRVVEQAKEAGVDASSVVRHGAPVSEIVDEAKEWGADIIVISTHGRSGISRLLLGSVASQVVNRADCPVLLCRTSSDD